ncbi:hypothetical protein ACI2KG_23040 [Pseudomonas sp. NPDC089407]|uniref:hypothetical protein n=1 Tax=Pseudomonas sp. NPDC089407 TaxID=3364464 RepID=UPI00384AE0C8
MSQIAMNTAFAAAWSLCVRRAFSIAYAIERRPRGASRHKAAHTSISGQFLL